MLDLAKFPPPWKVVPTRPGNNVPKIVAANNRTVMNANWAMLKGLSTQEIDELWDALRSMVLAGNQKIKQLREAT